MHSSFFFVKMAWKLALFNSRSSDSATPEYINEFIHFRWVVQAICRGLVPSVSKSNIFFFLKFFIVRIVWQLACADTINAYVYQTAWNTYRFLTWTFIGARNAFKCNESKFLSQNILCLCRSFYLIVSVYKMERMQTNKYTTMCAVICGGYVFKCITSEYDSAYTD